MWETFKSHFTIANTDAMKTSCADKFGNIYFVCLPQDVSDEIEEDPTGGKIKWEQGKLRKASLIPGGVECVMYGTVMGSLGALLAFSSRDDVDFFSHLEMHMREEHPPLWGRDHMAYRSAYFPVKDVIDGDLTPGEVLKKLEEVRNKIVKIKMRYECQKHRVTIRF
ncbi:unnamed protein product [Lactuca saligna]|uniref:RSE1/DDB1/CPSF1 C-terminal domain-containing protein n=1 Tax=Lactuca saligna TaxID=75948 RepID=A0AA35ZNP8_LACSI|nr:unnamed protein product [Lactuca saligna]